MIRWGREASCLMWISLVTLTFILPALVLIARGVTRLAVVCGSAGVQ